MAAGMTRIYYRIRPVHAPVRYAKIESYPTYEACMKRIQEIIWIVQRDMSADLLEYEVDQMENNDHCMFIHTITRTGWKRPKRPQEEA